MVGERLVSAGRRLRIVRYRGSAHGANEYPSLVDAGYFRDGCLLASGTAGIGQTRMTARRVPPGASQSGHFRSSRTQPKLPHPARTGDLDEYRPYLCMSGATLRSTLAIANLKGRCAASLRKKGAMPCR